MSVQIYCADQQRQAKIKHFHKLHKLSQPQQTDKVWLVEKDNQLIGVARLVLQNQIGWLRGVFMAPNYRECGYGSQLIQSLLNEATGEVYAFARPNLIGFYQRLGFNLIDSNPLSSQLPTDLAERFNRYRVSQPQLNALHFKPYT